MEQPNPPENRNIDTGTGNYNERIEGDYIQSKNNTQIHGNNNWIVKTLNVLLDKQNTVYSGQRTRQDYRNRCSMLNQVKYEVDSRLKQSLHNAALINLQKEGLPQQVKHPWDIEVKVSDQVSLLLSSETKILEVFEREEIVGKLLILGAPGSGKTTTLLELAKELITCAENNEDEPIPVLFNLSSWKDDNQGIAEWLVAELKEKYGVHKNIGQQWLEEHQLLPLLDGLDELRATRQEKCIQAINRFLLSANRPSHLVVCSRQEEYELCNIKLSLNGAICLRLLTEKKICKYLNSVNRQELWYHIQKDQSLLNLAKIPLFLSIITLAYEEVSFRELQEFCLTDKERLQYLLDAYIRRMIKRPIKNIWYFKAKEPEQKNTKLFLTLTAKNLCTDYQTEFLIEKMQPDFFLEEKLQKLEYTIGLWLNSTLFGLLIFFLIIKLVGVSLGTLPLASSFLIISLIIFPCFFGLQGIINTLISLAFLFIAPNSLGTIILIFNQIRFIGCSDIFIYKQIKTSEKLVWSIQESIRSFIRLVFWGLFVIAILLVLKNIPLGIGDTIFNYIMAFFSLSFPFIIIIYVPVKSIKVSEIEIRKIPNQGILQTAINTGVYSLIFGVVGLLVSGLIAWSNNKLDSWIYPGNAYYGIAWMLSFGLSFSIIPGFACLQHFTLRLILWWNGYIPWKYARFLDYCTERLFLQRVGGRYRFIHKLLQDHFAEMEFKRD